MAQERKGFYWKKNKIRLKWNNIYDHRDRRDVGKQSENN